MPVHLDELLQPVLELKQQADDLANRAKDVAYRANQKLQAIKQEMIQGETYWTNKKKYPFFLLFFGGVEMMNHPELLRHLEALNDYLYTSREVLIVKETRRQESNNVIEVKDYELWWSYTHCAVLDFDFPSARCRITIDDYRHRAADGTISHHQDTPLYLDFSALIATWLGLSKESTYQVLCGEKVIKNFYDQQGITPLAKHTFK